MKRLFVKKVGMLTLGTLLFFGGSSVSSLQVMAIVDHPPLALMQAQASDNPLALWLDRLEYAESKNAGDAHLKILDVNGKYSYGCLQFQADTFLNYGKAFHLIPANTQDFEPLIYQCNLQKELATDMIRDNYDNWHKWYTSVTKVIGMPPKENDLAMRS